MADPSSSRDSVEELAEEFADRLRRGERPSLTEYTAKYPQYADAIAKLFPALLLMEQFKPAASEATGPFSPRGGTAEEPKLEALGDFRILREVGRGGMGIVYEAVQVSLGRHVALKVLPQHALLEPRHLQRFQREAKAAARLHHTNIVPVYGVGEENGLHYYVMQFIQGLGLDEVLAELRRLRRAKGAPDAAAATPDTAAKSVKAMSAQEVAQSLLSGNACDAPRLPGAKVPPSDPSIHLPGQSAESTLSETGRPYWQSVARIGVQVAEALAYASSQGILHRDIKPSNLLLDTHGTVWVTDFGLAKAADSEDLTHSGDIVGTLRYMAPERFESRCDVRSDLYALGLTLYELLTLRPAFVETDRNKLLQQVMHEEPPRPRKLNPQVPRDLETVVRKAIARDAAQRYQTPGELAEDLNRFLDFRPILARPIGVLERLVKWAKRRPAVATLVLVSGVAALALVGAAVALVYNARLGQALNQAEYNRYFLHIARAQSGLQQGQLTLVERLLDECPEERRNWEWRYLKRQCHAALFSKLADGPVAFSPDGTRLASTGSDRTVMLWDATTGQEIHTFGGHSGAVWGMAFGPDGKRLATTASDAPVKVWDVRTGEELFSLPHRHSDSYAYWGVAFSPDGKRLATTYWDGKVKVWDLTPDRTSDRLECEFEHTGNVICAVFSPDGRYVASAGQDQIVKVWDLSSRQMVHSLKGHTDDIRSLAFSPDGLRLASASADWAVRVWGVPSGALLRTLIGHKSIVTDVAFSPDSQRLASAGLDQAVQVWDATTYQLIHTVKGHTLGVDSVAFSPDGRRLVTSSGDGTVKLWDATLAQQALTLQGHTGWVKRVVFDPQGQRLASAGYDRTVRIWDVTTGQVLRTLTGHASGIECVAFSPDGTRLASGSGTTTPADRVDTTVKVWDLATGRVIYSLEGHSMSVLCVAFSPDGTKLASAGEDHTVKIWNLTTGRLEQTFPHDKWVGGVAFSPDGRRLASGSLDGKVTLWDTTTWQPVGVLKGHTRGVWKVSFHPDGRRLASASQDQTVRVWDLATGQTVLQLRGHRSTIWDVAYSPDGTRLASAGMDQSVKVWDADSGEEVLTLDGHRGMVFSVAFSPDGHWLASAGSDRTVKLWDARPWTAKAAQELPIEREAHGLLDFLFAKPLSKEDVMDSLRSPTIRPEARELALTLVDHYRAETDPERYHQAAWTIVRQPYLNAFQHDFALRQAATACRLAPQRALYLSTLGMAQYRAGQYPAARATLAQADLLHRAAAASLAFLAQQLPQALVTLRHAQLLRQAIPANLAFLAMTHHQLGQETLAQAALEHLREIAKKPEWAEDEVTRAFLREAEAVAKAGRANPTK